MNDPYSSEKEEDSSKIYYKYFSLLRSHVKKIPSGGKQVVCLVDPPEHPVSSAYDIRPGVNITIVAIRGQSLH